MDPASADAPTEIKPTTPTESGAPAAVENSTTEPATAEGVDADVSDPVHVVNRLNAVRLSVDEATDANVSDTLAWASETMAGQVRRAELPVKKVIDPKEASIWSILKKNIGKNLSKISMPIALNEPLSATQRLCEEMEHSRLLDLAAAADDPSKQLLYIAAFAISGYSCTFFRGGRKPFNPLLGETFDYVDTERKFRYVAEQVSHHPPMTAAFASSQEWELLQEAGGDTKFRPTCLKIIPKGRVRLKLHRTGSVFEWNKVTTSVEDIMSGNRWVDHYGNLVITNSTTKDHAVVAFTEATVMLKKDKRRSVKGSIYTGPDAAATAPVYTLTGKWHETLVCPELNEVIFEAPSVSADRVAEMYGFSAFTCGLNELPPDGTDLRKAVASTDTRLRPDQRMLELNEPGANDKKLELEQLQRDRRSVREEAQEEWTPRHFVLKRQQQHAIPLSPRSPRKRMSFSMKKGARTEAAAPLAEAWEYKGAYWTQKVAGEFPETPPLW